MLVIWRRDKCVDLGRPVAGEELKGVRQDSHPDCHCNILLIRKGSGCNQ